MFKMAEKLLLICLVVAALILVCSSMYVKRTDDQDDLAPLLLQMKRNERMNEMELLADTLKRNGGLRYRNNYAALPPMPWLMNNKR
ncbi:hypothetical protein HOLleu_21661 [Holothuria leucospilota]|uniref:Uncharacterized protein n=1 Tax=Holothuria leucospilota TaxID=206669 RepID=A0A9Q1H453_HOLLE|nr:hypothetical protein HOLleu_21661 [Holothuria leucospilota]